MADSVDLIRAAVKKRNAYAQAYQAAFDERVESLLSEVAQIVQETPALLRGEVVECTFRRTQFEVIVDGETYITLLPSEEVLEELARRLSELGVTLTVTPFEQWTGRDVEFTLYIPA